MKRGQWVSMVAMLAVLAAGWGLDAGAGPLTPPGAPGDTMKTLQEVYDKADEAEARIPISSIPFTISQSGSYYLTQNLGPAAQNTNGITVNADNVTIDLNGYSLIGAGKTAGTSGSGICVPNFGPSIFRLTVKNGVIAEWRVDGIGRASSGIQSKRPERASIEKVSVKRNGISGLCLGSECTVRESYVELNDCNILCQAENVLENNVVANSGTAGINIEWARCLVKGNKIISDTIIISESGISCVVRENMISCYKVEKGSPIQVRSWNALIEKNYVSSSVDVTFIRVLSSSCILRGNICRGDGTYTATEYPVYLDNQAHNCQLIDNFISPANTGPGASPRVVYVAPPCRNVKLDLLISDLPYVVEWPCRARLTGDLSMTDTGHDGIVVMAPDVTLDLGGFSLTGPGGQATDYSGVRLHGACSRSTVCNGTIQKWRYAGINAQTLLAEDLVIKNIVSNDNGFLGLAVAKRARISDCQTSLNKQTGIYVIEGAMVTNCISAGNQYGIYVISTGNVIVDNQVMSNENGIKVSGVANYIARNVARNVNNANYIIASGNTLGTGDNANINY